MASRGLHGAGFTRVLRRFTERSPDPSGTASRARNIGRSLQLLAAIAVVAIAVFTAQQLWLTRHTAMDSAAMQMTRLDMVFAEQTGRAVETVDLILRNTLDLTPDRAKANPADVTDVLRRRIAGIRQVSALAVADPSGTVVAASKPELIGQLPPAGMAALSMSRVDADGGLRISEPLRDSGGAWTALMTRRLQGRDGRFNGIAVAYLNLAYFEDFYEAVELPETGTVMLHLRNGTVLARFPRENGIVGTSFANHPQFAAVLAHGMAGTVVVPSPVDATRRILAIRALRSFPLAISVSVSEQQALVAWWTEVWIFSAAALFGGLGLVGVLLYLSRQAREAELADRLRTMQELTRIASLDSLTGLLNRTTLTERLDRRLAWAQGGRGEVALLFLDLDGFKQINDNQGHKAGDAVLRVVAERIAAVSRSASADVARWGGDEFVIITADRDPAAPGTPSDATVLAGNILREISLPIDVDGQTVRVGGTIGVATCPQDGNSPEILVGAADAAMYDGKQAGGNIVRVYDPELASAVAASSGLERDLREAMRQDALSVVYQPIIAMPGERCMAFEALLRWHHPTRGNVPPAAFIPVAEHSGLIGRLGQWVLERACHEAVGWGAAGGPAVSVNVSLAQVTSGQLPQDVAAALERSGLPPGQLHLELTESMVGADHLRIIPVLKAVRDMGVSIALDDFGTGFSSLSRLHDWPVNIVKIDKTFVRSLERDGTAVIRATLLVAREYGLGVTVEGVETVAQWRELEALGVRSFQGFLFSHPLEAQDVKPWLEQVGQHGERGFGRRTLEQSPLLDEAR